MADCQCAKRGRRRPSGGSRPGWCRRSCRSAVVFQDHYAHDELLVERIAGVASVFGAGHVGQGVALCLVLFVFIKGPSAHKQCCCALSFQFLPSSLRWTIRWATLSVLLDVPHCIQSLTRCTYRNSTMEPAFSLPAS